MITGNTGLAQLPMKERAKNVYAEIVKRNGIRRHFIDSKVVDYMLKKGMVKISKRGTSRASHSIVVPVNKPKLPEIEDTGGPYAKRKAAMEELKKQREDKKAKAEEKLQKKIEEANEFYYFMKGQYHYSEKYPVSIERHATHIYGILNGKPFFAKPPANKKKKPKLTKSDLTWLRLKAK